MATPGSATPVNGRQALLEIVQVARTGVIQCSVIRAIVDLGIPDILARSGGQLTVGEIAEQLPDDAVNIGFLARIMTYAVTCNIFQEVTDSHGGVVADEHKRFRQTEASEALLETETPEPLLSMAHWVRFVTHNNCMEPLKYLAPAVLSGEKPSNLALGMDEWEATRADPMWGQTVSWAMAARSDFHISEIIKVYKGFRALKRVVDVGGGTGASLAAITRAYPDIHGVNFDLPYAIKRAPSFPRVEHVEGDMFKAVPEGDAIFMKQVLHDWTDQECVKILENCFKSLPPGGKVIIIDQVLPDPKEATSEEYVLDIIMLAAASGKERTAPEWLCILNAANFQRVEMINSVLPLGLSIIEGYKP